MRHACDEMREKAKPVGRGDYGVTQLASSKEAAQPMGGLAGFVDLHQQVGHRYRIDAEHSVDKGTNIHADLGNAGSSALRLPIPFNP